MRIISGDYKGRKLETPFGKEVRPTAEKVKEAVFSILAPDIYDSVFVDLFAGTGNMGLEALSRGAARAYFCDNSRDSLSIIKRNIKTCKAEDKSRVFAGDYQRALSSINEKVDIFFLDPPYNQGFLINAIEKIAEYDLLAEDGIILAEHDKYEEMPETICGFEKIKEKKYGSILISIYC